MKRILAVIFALTLTISCLSAAFDRVLHRWRQLSEQPADWAKQWL